jgi:hypothetical protein
MNMKRIPLVLSVLAVAAVCLASSSIAQAQATRTWVSGVGDDVNPCSRTAPCKTFAGAISKTAAGGEISVLDPGGFGAVTITKSITLNGDGTLAGILAATVNGIIINALATDKVVLRSLSINGAGSLCLSGIRVLQASLVLVENTSITNCANFGIEGANTTASTNLIVNNVTITNTNVGIRQSSLAGNASTIRNTRINLGSIGVELLGGFSAVSESIISNNNSLGLVAKGTSTLHASRNVITFNPTGVNAFVAGSTINLAQNDITFNSTNGVLVAAGATCNRFQNNQIFGNFGSQINGTCNPQTPQ